MASPPQPRAPSPSQSLHYASAAFAITWLVTAWRVGPSSMWTSDYASLQGLASGVVGFEGFVSQGVATIVRKLPIGTLVQRVGLMNALGAALSAWFACALACQALKYTTSKRFASWLALGSSLIVALGTRVQHIATVAGGPCIAAALGLACLWLMVRLSDKLPSESTDLALGTERRDYFLLGGVVATTWLESHVIGMLVTGVAGTLWALSHRARPTPSQLWTLGGFGAVVACIGVPCFVARRSLLASSVERPPFDSLQFLSPFSHVASRLGLWLHELGPIWFWVSLAGLVALAFRTERRRTVWVFVTLAVATVLLPINEAAAGRYGHAVVVIGTVMVCVSAAVGCRDIVCWATIRRPSAFALGATLAVVLQAVTVLARTEDINFTTNRYRSLGEEAWIDEAFVVLPARAIVFTRTPLITHRLLSAQIAQGIRPDVLVVPIDRATRPHMVGELLAIEPALLPTLRELAINGRPSENSLAGLADARPLYLEFDGSWDPRVREHLLVQPFFHRVFSQTLGRSDRATALPGGQRAVERIVAATESAASAAPLPNVRDPGDTMTRAIVELRLKEQLTLLLALGDRQAFDQLAVDYDRVYSGSKWMAQVRKRIGASTRGGIVAFDLLAPAGNGEPAGI